MTVPAHLKDTSTYYPVSGLDSAGNAVALRFDASAGALMTIGYAHHEIHAGSQYFVVLSEADLGAKTTPNDEINLSFTTPDTTKWFHMMASFYGASGAKCTIIEDKTGGGGSPEGTVQTYNSNRNSTNTSAVLDVAGANASQMSYNAAAFTGGTTLVEEYISAGKFGGSSATHEEELILKQNTPYQIALFDTGNNPGTIKIAWYEHTDRN